MTGIEVDARIGAWNWPPATLLGGLSRPARERMAALGTLVQYPAPGRVLMREGEPTNFVLLLLDGVVKVTASMGDGRDALLTIRVGGDLLGEFAALDGRPRSATVTACGPVVGRYIPRAEFLDGLRRDPELAHAVTGSVVAKTRQANSRRVDLNGCAVLVRLARVLHEIATTYGERDGNHAVIRWPLTQPELASLAAAAEPTVHKALRELRTSGVVSTAYRSLTVLDLVRLRDIAYPDLIAVRPVRQDQPAKS